MMNLQKRAQPPCSNHKHNLAKAITFPRFTTVFRGQFMMQIFMQLAAPTAPALTPTKTAAIYIWHPNNYLLTWG
jgi:hypothetical protein